MLFWRYENIRMAQSQWNRLKYIPTISNILRTRRLENSWNTGLSVTRNQISCLQPSIKLTRFVNEWIRRLKPTTQKTICSNSWLGLFSLLHRGGTKGANFQDQFFANYFSSKVNFSRLSEIDCKTACFTNRTRSRFLRNAFLLSIP